MVNLIEHFVFDKSHILFPASTQLIKGKIASTVTPPVLIELPVTEAHGRAHLVDHPKSYRFMTSEYGIYSIPVPGLKPEIVLYRDRLTKR